MHWVSADHARRCDGRAVRPAVLGRGSGRGDRRSVRRPQPQLTRAADRLQGRAGAGRHAARLGGAVRAARLLRPRSATRRCCSTAPSACVTNGPTSRSATDASTRLIHGTRSTPGVPRCGAGRRQVPRDGRGRCAPRRSWCRRGDRRPRRHRSTNRSRQLAACWSGRPTIDGADGVPRARRRRAAGSGGRSRARRQPRPPSRRPDRSLGGGGRKLWRTASM